MILSWLTARDIIASKNSLLNLKYKIVHSDEIKIDNGTRKELFDFALDVVQDEFYMETMRSLSKIQDN